MKTVRFFILTNLLVVTLLANLSCKQATKNFEYASGFYKIQLTDTVPFVKYFSVDALGNAQLAHNPVLWTKSTSALEYELRKISDTEVQICRKGASGIAAWQFKFEERKFMITSNFRKDSASKGIDFRFDKHENHTTLLGLMSAKKKMMLPAVLHLPDMGTFRVETNLPGITIDYDASRKKGTNFISVNLPAATEQQTAISHTFTVASIYPPFPGVEQEKFAGYRRNYLNLFQVNPKLAVIANNTCSDPCAFTLFLSSMLALHTPPLVGSLTALDLLKMSIERYLNGMKAYGLVGYGNNYEGADAVGWKSPYNSLDSYPSLVISACNYIKGSKDKTWAVQYYPRIKEWMDIQMKRDYNKNGLVEYELSGNSGSWDGIIRPANWWDTIGYGYEDAFSNALTYEALNLMVLVSGMVDKKEDAAHYLQLSAKLKASYFKTFYNPKTGVLAGWKSKDGKLHDYYFLAVNSMAVYYNLVPENKIKEVMMALWDKMQEVGYQNFTLGIPGNLVSIRKEDYTHPDPRWGGGKMEDGSDAFQRYENGGASINWSYFTLKALKKAGLDKQLQAVTDGILSGINAGEFQGACEKEGMTKDWKTWNGECWGYEGYLCDGFLVLLALNPDDK